MVNTHSKLAYQNNHLIFKSVDKTEMIHLSEIDTLVLETTDISITTMLIKRLMDEKVLVIFCDDKRLPIANISPFYARHDSSLQISKQLSWTNERKSIVWTKIIANKISNQAEFLRINDFEEKAKSLDRLYDELEVFDPTNREGHAARIYFNTLFGNDFSRQDNCDINIALDYGYSLLLSLFSREIVVTGCLTQLGLKHSNQFNQFNLASDLMEAFRPIVDEIVYENRHLSFIDMKPRLLKIFVRTFRFNNKDMYLSNMVSEYVKKVVKNLNSEKIRELPEFRI
nr:MULTISPECIES: type II CRISPR-associated endonuclease Cas1 [unclassified Gemella]